MLRKFYPFSVFSFRVTSRNMETLEIVSVSPRFENTVKKLSFALIFAMAALTGARRKLPRLHSRTQPTVSRTSKAMHYRLQGGSTKVDFQGTDLLQGATGEAKIEGKKTNFQIEAKFQGFEDATKFGLEYLTYVMWAVSPQGRPVNLGELTLDHHWQRVR